jgi:hypothetical protein
LALDFHALTVAAAGVVHDDEGNIRWPVVVGGIITAAMVGLGAATIHQGQEIAAQTATINLLLQRLQSLESMQLTQANDRYRRSDADRELSSIERRLTDRLDAMEARFAAHAAGDELRWQDAQSRKQRGHP